MLVNYLHCFLWFRLYYLLHLLRSFRNSYKFIAIQICYLNTIRIHEFLKNHLRKGVFCNVKLSNLTNVLQSCLRTESAGECIFRASGEQILKTFPLSDNYGGTFVGSMYVPVCPKKFWICHWFVMLHISGTIHHMIVIYGTHV